MFVDINDLHLLKFNNCKDCDECCKNKYLAPLVLDDFEKVYKYFPIIFAKLDFYKPVIMISSKNGCPYLENGLCTIYENRPPACKLYPYSPWYDKLLLDIACKGVGIEGDYLPLNFEDFKKSKFFEKRVEDIDLKIKKTREWLRENKIEFFTNFKGVKLYKLTTFNDKYAQMVKKSQIHLEKYKDLLTT